MSHERRIDALDLRQYRCLMPLDPLLSSLIRVCGARDDVVEFEGAGLDTAVRRCQSISRAVRDTCISLLKVTQ